MIPESPERYRHPSGIECWQISQHLPHPLASAFEYVWRYREKGGLEDLRKAARWLRIERERRRFSHIGISWDVGRHLFLMMDDLPRTRTSPLQWIVRLAADPGVSIYHAARAVLQLHRGLRRELAGARP